ncbi:hypothetical protein F2P79_011602 [Pimephales promelas]|nr:hypothetical protein F2P79_011602 [Pimephales promelas]
MAAGLQFPTSIICLLISTALHSMAYMGIVSTDEEKQELCHTPPLQLILRRLDVIKDHQLPESNTFRISREQNKSAHWICARQFGVFERQLSSGCPSLIKLDKGNRSQSARQRTHPEKRQTAPLRQRSELTVAAECAVIRVMWVFSEPVGSRGRSGTRTGR